MQDVYFFELPGGPVALAVDHRPSPMGGHQVSLTRDEHPLRPSQLGVAGFDSLWEDGLGQAYGVSDAVAAALLESLQRAELEGEG
jgi:hypothetical protein